MSKQARQIIFQLISNEKQQANGRAMGKSLKKKWNEETIEVFRPISSVPSPEDALELTYYFSLCIASKDSISFDSFLWSRDWKLRTDMSVFPMSDDNLKLKSLC